jgi:hypothetical protein
VVLDGVVGGSDGVGGRGGNVINGLLVSSFVIFS